MLYEEIKTTPRFKEIQYILRGLTLSQLQQVYYYLFKYDTRLPDLFSLIPSRKLKRYLYMSFYEQCYISEIEDALKILNYKEKH